MVEKTYTDIVKQLIRGDDDNLIEKNYKCNAFREPLYWFIKLLSKKRIIKMGDIAQKMDIDKGVLTKKLNADNDQARPLYFEDVEKLCSILGFSLSSILFFYENKEIFEKNFSKNTFSDLTKLLSTDSKYFLDFSALYGNRDIYSVSKTKKSEDKSSELHISEDVLLSHMLGKWYFYFPSSDSSIIKSRKKEIEKTSSAPSGNPEIMELYDLYSPDHIYSGIFTVDFQEGQYKSVLKYMTNPQTLSILTYEGVPSSFANSHAVSLALSNKEGNDIMFMIIDTLSVEKASRYIMSAVLSLSRNKVEEKHRPCSLRMILSRKLIEFDSPAYKIMLSNLMMNDSVIRIDEQGYSELRKFQNQYDSTALNTFFQKYPDIEHMTREGFIDVNRCAFINESLLQNLTNMDDYDRNYLEALLRLHSIAPWYAKTKTSKTNSLLKLFNDN